MKFEVTRDVVSDLWALSRSGDASTDSRALVDAFLAADADFAKTLKESVSLRGATPALQLSPDAERRLLDDARQRARTKLLVIGGAIGLVGLVSLVALIGVMMVMYRGH